MLCISLVFSLASMAAVPPDALYAGYIDIRIICLLFCLMAVVQGFQECGLFLTMAQRLLSGCRQIRPLMLILVMLSFFSSMLVTNDVALITFVPFTILVLNFAGKKELIVRAVVLETLAANLGSMATQVGNPQNLFLYANYDLSAAGFFSVTLPIAFASLIILSLASIFIKRQDVRVSFECCAKVKDIRLLCMYAGLFVLCLLSVFRVLHYAVATAAVLLFMLVFSRRLLLKVDYGLLATFVCFFLFAGNMGRIPQVHELLSRLLEKNTLATSVLASQVISNVPAAVLLSGFTADWRSLLAGVNVGGLGTPIASLASLISLKIYLRSDGTRPLFYLAVFTAANIAALALLLPLAALLR